MAQKHKDYSGTPLYKKLGIKEGARVLTTAAPDGFDKTLGKLPPGARVSTRASTSDVAIVFSTEERDLVKRFATAKKNLVPDGRLWVAYPKKSSKLATDLTFESVQEIGLESGLVDNKSCAIDDDWSGVQFVYRLKDRPKA